MCSPPLQDQQPFTEFGEGLLVFAFTRDPFHVAFSFSAANRA
ncbi:MAG: hypothetical protein JWN70_6467 [Planctomycetaceae bacterium]|nr:hypothetical protein [Planctomycetaceae bacterium]